MVNYDGGKMAEAIFKGMCEAFDIDIPNPDTADIYHTVVIGDTLWGLSRRYGVSLNSIVALRKCQLF